MAPDPAVEKPRERTMLIAMAVCCVVPGSITTDVTPTASDCPPATPH